MTDLPSRSPARNGQPIAPLLKWPGGKRGLARYILPFVPRKFGRYYEPFMGSGAVFFALRPRSATLSDANSDLVETYIQVRDHPENIIDILKCMPNTEEDYYRIRSLIPRSPSEKAARFMYLCTLAFNGIHRYNLKGQFNVPYGFKTHLRVCDEARIRAASERLSTATLQVSDFERAARLAKRGDLIYFDPPYTVAHNNNGFVKYNASIFSWSDQERLAEVANDARRRGCFVLVSNANHSCIRSLYPDFVVSTISRHSIIASRSEFRKPITECLFWGGDSPSS
jgi:DNA adenine methylase